MRALVTGSGGLVGSEAVRHFVEEGWVVIGIDNDMRRYFFGDSASTAATSERLREQYKDNFTWRRADIRNEAELDAIVRTTRPDLIVHAAAQPAHDWAVKEPKTDFTVNALGTLNLLEAARKYVPDSTFVYCSTSKVYGDNPNHLPLVRVERRLDLPRDHPYFYGIDTTMSIDLCTHSLFGASKASADLMVQEYGRYFDMPTVCFRPGCISGPNHAGAQLHGFLSYLMRCTVTGDRYTVFGYEGLQVRCNIHSADLVSAFECYHRAPKPGSVYNIGGGRFGSCSMLEAIELCRRIAGRELDWLYSPEARIGDHRWWISNNAPFEWDYPDWEQKYDVEGVLQEIHDENVERWHA